MGSTPPHFHLIRGQPDQIAGQNKSANQRGGVHPILLPSVVVVVAVVVGAVVLVVIVVVVVVVIVVVVVVEITNIAWTSFDLQEHKIHNNASLVMGH